MTVTLGGGGKNYRYLRDFIYGGPFKHFIDVFFGFYVSRKNELKMQIYFMFFFIDLLALTKQQFSFQNEQFKAYIKTHYNFLEFSVPLNLLKYMSSNLHSVSAI